MNSATAEVAGSVFSDADERQIATVIAIAELRHPHLIVMRPLGAGEGFEPDLNGGRYLPDLMVLRGGKLPLPIALRILLDALSGLAALHRARLDDKPLDFVHGEVRAESIVVGRDGVARLVPLTKSHWSTAAQEPQATGYAAPEKLLGDAIDQRADVFSFGVLLWEAMEGKPLFRDLSIDEVITHLVGGKIERPAPLVDSPWSAELAEVVMRALAVDPGDRWDHVGVMGADIETIAEGHIAKSPDVAALVTGRDVSRDSLSDEVTMRVSSLSSLSPYAQSIPAAEELNGPPSSIRTATKVTESGALADESAPRRPLAERRRRQIVGGALAVSALLLAIAGIKSLGHKAESTATATVLVPTVNPSIAAAEPVQEPTPAEIAPTPPAPEPAPEPPRVAVAEVLPEPASSPPGNPSMPAAATPTAKSSRLAAKPAAPTASATTKGKPKDDPFGLMHPVRSKAKDDPFGL